MKNKRWEFLLVRKVCYFCNRRKLPDYENKSLLSNMDYDVAWSSLGIRGNAG